MSAPTTKVTPISGFPELLPAQRLLELHFLDVIREVFELHGFAPLETRAVEPVERPAGQGRRRRQGDLRHRPARGRRQRPGCRAGPALRPHRALRALRARERAASSPSRSAATRSRRCGAGSGRRRGGSASPPRATSTSSTSASWRRTSRPRCRSSSRGVLATAGGGVPIQVNNRKIPEGFFLGIGLTDVLARCRSARPPRPVGPRRSRPCSWSRARRRSRPRCWPASVEQHRPSFADAVRAWACSTRPSTKGSRRRLAVIGGAEMEQAPACSATCRSPRPRLLHRHRLRDVPDRRLRVWGSVCSGGRVRLARGTDRRTTYPGVGISIGLTRLVHLLVSKRGLTASRSTPAAVLVAVVDEEGREASRRVAAALRARGIPCEVAPSAARFGKQIRYADRRGIPFVWFPGAGEGVDQVKDIRSGDQVDADPATWECPEADLKPAVVTPRADLGALGAPLAVSSPLRGGMPLWRPLTIRTSRAARTRRSRQTRPSARPRHPTAPLLPLLVATLRGHLPFPSPRLLRVRCLW